MTDWNKHRSIIGHLNNLHSGQSVAYGSYSPMQQPQMANMKLLALEKMASAPYRLASNLLKVDRKVGTFPGQLVDGANNVARTRQNVAKQLQHGFDPLAGRQPGWALTQDVGSYRRRLESGALRQGTPANGRSNFFRGSTNDSSEAFFNRTGNPIPQATSNSVQNVMGTQVYRGGFGADPWGYGYYGGALQHGTPSRHLAYQYGRGPGGVGMVNHHSAAPSQLVGPDFSLEFSMLHKRPNLNNKIGFSGSEARPLSRLKEGDKLDAEGMHYELPLTRQNNPYLGTELFSGNKSRFVDAGDKVGQRAIANYANNLEAKLPGAPQFRQGRGWNTLSANPRLERMAHTNEAGFNQLMNRRADRLFNKSACVTEVDKHRSIVGFIKRSAYGSQPSNAYGSESPMQQQQSSGFNMGGAVNGGLNTLYALDTVNDARTTVNTARTFGTALKTGGLAGAKFGGKLVPGFNIAMSAWDTNSRNNAMRDTAKSLGPGDAGWNAYKQTTAYGQDKWGRNAASAGMVGAGIGAAIGGLVTAPLGGVGAVPGAMIGAGVGAVGTALSDVGQWAKNKFTGYNRDMEMQGMMNSMGATSGEDILSHGLSQYQNSKGLVSKGWFGNTTDNAVSGQNALAADLQRQMQARAK
jgi:hypothetical protein